MKFKVQIPEGIGRKRYLAELIENEFWEWHGKKFFLNAPTGMGKTTFVVKEVLAYLRKRGKKLLIVCNRKLLRIQFWCSIIEQFVSYAELEECVQIVTYQELAEIVKRGSSLKKFFLSFEIIVCDEVHFFYSDSDFNGHGTYVLFHEMIEAGITKTMIFMSATLEEVRPLLEQTIRNCAWRLEMTGRNTAISKKNAEIISYNYSRYADYKRFNCIAVLDIETLCDIIVKSPKKSLLFINNKEKGIDIKEQLINRWNVDKSQIAVISADNMDIGSDVVQGLSIGNRLNVKILITTAVLDNGVSVHDPEVGNVLIETESRIEFVQMLGRIRADDASRCNLYFVQRDKNEFMKRMNRYKEELEELKRIKKNNMHKNQAYYLQEIFGDGEMANFYKKVLVWMKNSSLFYTLPECESEQKNLEFDLQINEFAEHKIGDMYLAESRFYMLAVSDPLQVVYEMMSWIGKQPEELQVMESEYIKEQEQKFISELFSVQKFTLEQFKEFKANLVKCYHKLFFADIDAKNKTIENAKLNIICGRYGMELVIEEGTGGSRRNVYSILPVQKEEDNV